MVIWLKESILCMILYFFGLVKLFTGLGLKERLKTFQLLIQLKDILYIFLESLFVSDLFPHLFRHVLEFTQTSFLDFLVRDTSRMVRICSICRWTCYTLFFSLSGLVLQSFQLIHPYASNAYLMPAVAAAVERKVSKGALLFGCC